MGATRVPGSPAPTPEVLTRQLETSPFDMVGVVWDAESTPAGGAVQIRVRERQGWTEWQELEAADGGPDPRSQEGQQAAERAATEPLFVEDADAVQVRMDTADGAEPQQVTAVLVDPGDSAADEDAFALATASGSFRAFLIV